MKFEIDPATYQRKEIFDFFSHSSHPFYMVSFTQDVTLLHRYVKAHQLSFYYALTYLCTKALNQIEAFRYTIKDDAIWMMGERIPSFTDMKKGSELFHIVTAPMKDDMASFCQSAKQLSNAQNRFIEDDSNDEVVYISCLPWMEVTAMRNEGDFPKDDTIPRISWGKYVERDGTLQLTITMEVNHRLIDGYHIGCFHQQLTALINELPLEPTQK